MKFQSFSQRKKQLQDFVGQGNDDPRKTQRKKQRKNRKSILQTLEPRQVLNAGAIVFSEIQYNPAGSDSAAEWVELHNQLNVNVDISGWQLDDGIRYRFPEGSILNAGDYLVVSNDPAAATNPAIHGPFDGSLSNGGENLELRNNSGRLMDSVEYDDAGDWPVAPDGLGVTLAKFRIGTDSNDPRSWQSSVVVGGTPGSANSPIPSPAVQLSEIEISATAQRIELQASDAASVNLSGYSILQSGSTDQQVSLPATNIPAGGFASIDLSAIGLTVVPGDTLAVFGPGGTSIADAAIAPSGIIARADAYQGRWAVPDVATFGSANSFAFRDEIVINEISFHAAPRYPVQPDSQSTSTTELLAFNANWRYNRSGEDLGTDWFQNSHSVGGNWQSGAGVLAVESATLSQPIGTNLNGPNFNTTIAYYFETEFNVSANQLAEDTRIELSHLVDDGAVFYINGVEFYRIGMPTGVITSSTTATASIGNASEVRGIEIPSNLIQAGTNRLSVQVHQRAAGSSDIVMGAEVTAVTQEGAVTHADNDLEWVELYNRSSTPVDLTDWQFADAVSFDFDPSTTIAAGGYLVVTNDRAEFLLQHPSVDPTIVVGDFSGMLSNSGERLQLLDELGNPADEVEYVDGGRWAKAADGGGSTLELRDPDADNSVAEAWAASDESDNSQWQTVTYRGVANEPSGTNFPDAFNEFVLGLLDQGEVLLDDISVIQNPDGNARQLIQNGTFSGDTVGGSADRWRILGTHGSHGLTQVVVDPTNPSNQVLHLVATGPTYSLGNHAETTLKDGNTFVPIQNGAEYEISYRVKWISGSPQLNTRLYFNRVARTTVIDTPSTSGTPGQANSVAVVNAGPTFTHFSQSVAVPAPNQPVVISAATNDNNTVTRMTLVYSKDGGAWQQAPMTLGADGNYTATISGSADGTIVQFYVEAEDSLGVVSTFPAEGADSRALYRVEASAASPTGASNFRIITTEADSDFLHDPTNVMSNDPMGTTVVYDNVVYYDVGVRLKSSSRGRWLSTRLGYTIKFDQSQPFRGLFNTVNIDRSGPGRGDAGGFFGQAEIINWHVINRVGGVPGFNNDLVYVVAPRDSESSSAQLVLTGYRNDYLDAAYEDGSDGQLYKFSSIYSPTVTATVGVLPNGDPDPEGLKLFGSGLDRVQQTPMRDLGNDRETYRHNYLIENNEDQDNLEPAIRLAKLYSLPTAQFNAAVGDVIDGESFARTAAVMTLLGPIDNYFSNARNTNNNLVLFHRPDGKIEFFPWDHDFLSASASPTEPLVFRSDIQRVLSASPEFQRTFYATLVNAIDTTFNTAYMTQWTTHYNSLVSGGQDFGENLSYIGARSAFVTSQVNSLVPATDFEITTNGGNNFTVNQPSATLSGNGWLDIASFRLAGSDTELATTWTSNSAWELTVPLESGVNEIALEAIGFDGEVVSSDTISITNVSTSFPQREFLRLTEIHYNSPGGGDEFEFLELTNIGTESLDISGVSILEGNDILFVVPAGTNIPAGESWVIARNLAAFATRYPSVPSSSVLGPYSGALGNGGETITLLDTGGAEIMSVQYDDGGLWSELADGEGVSLELVDPATPLDRLDKFYSWQPSTQFGGSPTQGRSAASGVVITEILAHTDLPATDTIELFNSSDQPVDISGWWLSDDSNDYQQFQIPSNTILASGAYLTFDESDFGFRLSSAGESVYLTQSSGGQTSRLEDAVQFGASFNSQTFGRTPTFPPRLAPLLHASLGTTNGAFAFSDVVISELNYHPAPPNADSLIIDPLIADNDLEFIELYNRTAQPIDLANWDLSGEVEFAFDAGQTIGAGETLVLVSFDPANSLRLAAFQAHYGVDETVAIVGPFTGSLNNSYGLVELRQPDAPDEQGIPQVPVDQVVYDDRSPWSTDADGLGESLHRIGPATLGLLAASWTGDDPSPGQTITGASVVSVTINNDAATRSEVTAVEVAFDSVVEVDASNFQLIHIADDQTETIVTGIQVSLDHSDGQTKATLNFDATNFSISGVDSPFPATLADGRYELRYRDLGFSASETRLDSFFRKYGDTDGDDEVGLRDFADFRSAFGIDYDAAELNNGYDQSLDSDRNGIVGLVDFAAFRASFGR